MLINDSPMLKVVSPKSKRKLPLFVEEEQIRSLLNEVEFDSGFIGERDKFIIEFFYVTGIRFLNL